jgi:DNA-binding CsgD family transcriptional regulator
MAAMTDTFVVMAKRWAHGWELHIKGVGVTQVGTLSRAEAVAREYIALAHDIDDEKSFDVDVVPQLDATLAAQVRAARAQVREAERHQREAAAKQREVARRLGESGLSGREIAAVLGMTPQRVSQLIGKSAGSGVTAKRSSAAHTSRAARGATGHRSKARGAK